MFKTLVSLTFVVLSTFAFSQEEKFPKGPDSILTPGVLCNRPDSQRYKEQINYCERSVDSQTKKEIIATYDRERNFQIRQMQRSQFKIDHYIPLCMGGANERDNLWPQHQSIYDVTDPLEPVLCEKMAEGKLLQRDAVLLIKRAKNNLAEAQDILERARAL